jgi:hypothetical protein
MWVEQGLALVREGLLGPTGTPFEDWAEFRSALEREYGFLAMDMWRNDDTRCWEGNDGPIAVDVVEFVELEEDTADFAGLEETVRGLVSPLAPASHKSVPVFGPGGQLLGRVVL